MPVPRNLRTFFWASSSRCRSAGPSGEDGVDLTDQFPGPLALEQEAAARTIELLGHGVFLPDPGLGRLMISACVLGAGCIEPGAESKPLRAEPDTPGIGNSGDACELRRNARREHAGHGLPQMTSITLLIRTSVARSPMRQLTTRRSGEFMSRGNTREAAKTAITSMICPIVYRGAGSPSFPASHRPDRTGPS